MWTMWKFMISTFDGVKRGQKVKHAKCRNRTKVEISSILHSLSMNAALCFSQVGEKERMRHLSMYWSSTHFSARSFRLHSVLISCCASSTWTKSKPRVVVRRVSQNAKKFFRRVHEIVRAREFGRKWGSGGGVSIENSELSEGQPEYQRAQRWADHSLFPSKQQVQHSADWAEN